MQKGHWAGLFYVHYTSSREASPDPDKGNSQAQHWQNWLVKSRKALYKALCQFQSSGINGDALLLNGRQWRNETLDFI